jgi:repressor LexA
MGFQGEKMPLTKRQLEIVGFIREFLGQHGYSPTLEEIGLHFRMASLNAVYKHLKALEERGFIKRLPGQARSIQLVEQQGANSPTLPLLGYVAAGRPIEAVSNIEEISVPESFISHKGGFVLRVRGDSMIEEHIQDGDFVIVQPGETAHSGDMVIALLDGESATLKKYYREGGNIRLQPANPAVAPILVAEERVRIQGLVVGVIRKY